MSAPAHLLMAGNCQCPCHDTIEGNHADSAQRVRSPWPRLTRQGRGALAVSLTHVVEAAVACPVCRDHHCPALSGRPPELDKPRWNPPALTAAEITAAVAVFDSPNAGEGCED